MNREDFAKQWLFYRIMAVVVGSVLLVLTMFLISVRVLENPEPAFYAAAWTAHGYLFPVYVFYKVKVVIWKNDSDHAGWHNPIYVFSN
jgi:hypothetical protein